MLYDAIPASWREKKIRTAADIALELLWDHPPIIIHEEERRGYYTALEAFDKDQEPAPLTAFLREQTVKTWKVRFEREQERQGK